ncbi:protein efr3 [Anaeramoeba flamelloides]|uniref:Protein efr3 n=1 Tax=Anaeramoeba flamelloides TaxID=1746091 RepID=A0ABQ8Z405_9EUKA|nr:protein efr3 [Anaeramoeba flamelloides]
MGICCPKSIKKYKRLIDSVYPKNKDEDLRTRSADKFIQYAINNTHKLVKVGKYIEKKVRRDCDRKRYGRVKVGMKVMNLMIDSCSKNLILFGSNALSLVVLLIDHQEEELQILAVKTYLQFSETLDSDTIFTLRLMHYANYFKNMCCNRNKNVQIRNKTIFYGLKGIRGMLKITLSNLETSNVLTTIIPVLLREMQNGSKNTVNQLNYTKNSKSETETETETETDTDTGTGTGTDTESSTRTKTGTELESEETGSNSEIEKNSKKTKKKIDEELEFNFSSSSDEEFILKKESLKVKEPLLKKKRKKKKRKKKRKKKKNINELRILIAQESFELVSTIYNSKSIIRILNPMFDFFFKKKKSTKPDFVIKSFSIVCSRGEDLKFSLITFLLERLESLIRIEDFVCVVSVIGTTFGELQTTTFQTSITPILVQLLQPLIPHFKNKVNKNQYFQDINKLLHTIVHAIQKFSQRIDNQTVRLDAFSYLFSIIDKFETKYQEEFFQSSLSFAGCYDYIDFDKIDLIFNKLITFSTSNNKKIRLYVQLIICELFKPLNNNLFSFQKNNLQMKKIIPKSSIERSKNHKKQNTDKNNENNDEDDNDKDYMNEDYNFNSIINNSKKKKISFWLSSEGLMYNQSNQINSRRQNIQIKKIIQKKYLRLLTYYNFIMILSPNNEIQNYQTLFKVFKLLLNEYYPRYVVFFIPLLFSLQKTAIELRKKSSLPNFNFFSIQTFIASCFLYISKLYSENELFNYILDQIGDLDDWNKICSKVNLQIGPQILITATNSTLSEMDVKNLKRFNTVFEKKKILEIILKNDENKEKHYVIFSREFKLLENNDEKTTGLNKQRLFPQNKKKSYIHSNKKNVNSKKKHQFKKQTSFPLISPKFKINFLEDSEFDTEQDSEIDWKKISESESETSEIFSDNLSFKDSSLGANQLIDELIDNSNDNRLINEKKNTKDLFSSKNSKKTFQQIKEYVQAEEDESNNTLKSIFENTLPIKPNISTNLNKIDQNQILGNFNEGSFI